MEADKIRHDDLIPYAYRKLKSTWDCQLSFQFVRAWVLREHPDAVGFKWHSRWDAQGGLEQRSPDYRCILIECKATRSDFFSDQSKDCRDGHGIGRYRYYMTPKEVVYPEDVPEDWGLLWLRGSRVYVEKEAPDRGQDDLIRLRREILLLGAMSLQRRSTRDSRRPETL